MQIPHSSGSLPRFTSIQKVENLAKKSALLVEGIANNESDEIIFLQLDDENEPHASFLKNIQTLLFEKNLTLGTSWINEILNDAIGKLTTFSGKPLSLPEDYKKIIKQIIRTDQPEAQGKSNPPKEPVLKENPKLKADLYNMVFEALTGMRPSKQIQAEKIKEIGH